MKNQLSKKITSTITFIIVTVLFVAFLLLGFIGLFSTLYYAEDGSLSISDIIIQLSISIILILMTFTLLRSLWKYCNYIRRHYKAMDNIITEIEIGKIKIE